MGSFLVLTKIKKNNLIYYACIVFFIIFENDIVRDYER
jgi:hypothetical protein